MGKKSGSKKDKTSKKKSEELAKSGPSSLAKKDSSFTVGSIEKALLGRFPNETAESWDRCGLSVGDRSAFVSSIVIALDPTVNAIEQASSMGAELLITHHPLFLDAPECFSPAKSPAECSGAGVWAAIENNVATMAFHTSLDVSKAARKLLPSMLSLDRCGRVLKPMYDPDLGYGEICKIQGEKDKDMDLAHLSARCLSVFGKAPRVWGNPKSLIRTCVTTTGSASGLGALALDQGVDCLICGEVKYHDALNLSQAGLSIIELGHDISEAPLCAVLANSLTSLGFPADAITILDQSDNWSIPDAVRL